MQEKMLEPAPGFVTPKSTANSALRLQRFPNVSRCRRSWRRRRAAGAGHSSGMSQVEHRIPSSRGHTRTDSPGPLSNSESAPTDGRAHLAGAFGDSRGSLRVFWEEFADCPGSSSETRPSIAGLLVNQGEQPVGTRHIESASDNTGANNSQRAHGDGGKWQISSPTPGV